MIKYLSLLFITLSLYSSVPTDMLKLYEEQNYKEACSLGFKNFSLYKNDEAFISLYGLSCLNSDYIDRLAIPATALKHSEDARANAAYFSVILMQKKLLYHALIDGYDISAFHMPTSDYVLSKVFDLYIKLGKHQPKDYYIFQDPDDKRRNFKLYLNKSTNVTKMIIEEFYDTIFVKRHSYW
jgi:hypothetical protein